MPDVKGNGFLVVEVDCVEYVIPDDIGNILVDQEFDINRNDSDGDEITDEEW